MIGSERWLVVVATVVLVALAAALVIGALKGLTA